MPNDREPGSEPKKDDPYAGLCDYQPTYPVTGFAQIRVVSEAMRSGAFMSLFQAYWQASGMAS